MTTMHTPTGRADTDGRRMLAPPGWYQDPTGSGRRRWFDGRRWTARFYDEEAAAVPSVETAAGAGLPAGPAAPGPAGTVLAVTD